MVMLPYGLTPRLLQYSKWETLRIASLLLWHDPLRVSCSVMLRRHLMTPVHEATKIQHCHCTSARSMFDRRSPGCDSIEHRGKGAVQLQLHIPS
jgi:hypothetical protein